MAARRTTLAHDPRGQRAGRDPSPGSAQMTRRWTSFSSSRTLPGHPYRSRSASVSGWKPATGFPSWRTGAVGSGEGAARMAEELALE